MLAGMYASRNLGPDYVPDVRSLYPDIAKKHDLVLYPFFLDGVAGDRSLNLPDGLHPTAKGVEIIVERILPTVETFLARLPSAEAAQRLPSPERGGSFRREEPCPWNTAASAAPT